MNNFNRVSLIGHYGNDALIAQAAWVSTSSELTEEKQKRIPQFIEKLWVEGHETPFERGVLHFQVLLSIDVHIQLLKHRIGVSVNSESARYKELKGDNYYLPEDWEGIFVQETVWDDDGDYVLGVNDGIKDAEYWINTLKKYTKLGNDLYHQCLKDLTPVLGRKRAKESARYFKTYNSQIVSDVQFNMRSFANFIKLRNSPHAQKEIREIAQQMWALVEQIEGNPFEHTLKVIKEKIDKNAN